MLSGPLVHIGVHRRKSGSCFRPRMWFRSLQRDLKLSSRVAVSHGSTVSRSVFAFIAGVAVVALCFASEGHDAKMTPPLVLERVGAASEAVVVQTTYCGWGCRIQNALTGFLVGLFLFVASFPILAWNECQAARYYRMLFRARDAIVEAQGRELVDVDEDDLAFNGKLVCASGTLDVGKTPLTDTAFGFSLEHCVRLRRTVEMYQWVEKRHETSEQDAFGGGTTTRVEYTYERLWKDAPIDSDRFADRTGHENPDWWVGARSDTIEMDAARLGTRAQLAVGRGAICEMKWFDSKGLTVPVEKFQEKFGDVSDCEREGPASVYLTYEKGLGRRGGPRVGDVRVRFEWIPDSTATGRPVTVMAKQEGRALAPWSDGGDFCYDKVGSCLFASCCCCFSQCGSMIAATASQDRYAIKSDPASQYGAVGGTDTKKSASSKDQETDSEAGDRTRKMFELLNAADGAVPASRLLADNEAAERRMQLCLRLVGWLCMFLGLYLVCNPVLTLLDIVPIVGPIVRTGVWLLCLLSTLVLSTLIVLVAWVGSRPYAVIALSLVVAGGVAAVTYATAATVGPVRKTG